MTNTPQTPPYRLILKQFLFQSGLFIGLFIILFAFQNCAQELESNNSDLASLGEGLPFAFDAKMDHVAYMSCTPGAVGYEPNAFFSFKLGAYQSNSGLKFSDAFDAKTSQLSYDFLLEALEASPVNRSAQAQLGVRSISDYQQYYSTSDGFTVSNLLVPLTDTRIVAALAPLSGGARANSFPNLGAQKFEGRLNPLLNEISSQQMRTTLQSGGGILALTYNQADKSAGYALAPTANSTSSVYGSAMAISFAAAPTTGAAKVLGSASERQLLNGSATQGSWQCSTNFIYRVIRRVDLGTSSGSFCPNLTNGTEPNLSSFNATQLDSYYAIRSVLPAQYWDIDVVNKCAVLRTGVSGSCYGSEAAGLGIQYSSTCSGANCPNYVSVCKKI